MYLHELYTPRVLSPSYTQWRLLRGAQGAMPPRFQKKKYTYYTVKFNVVYDFIITVGIYIIYVI